jgi:hypothetical protein
MFSHNTGELTASYATDATDAATTEAFSSTAEYAAANGCCESVAKRFFRGVGQAAEMAVALPLYALDQFGQFCSRRKTGTVLALTGLTALGLSACNGEQPPFTDTVYVDYITPENAIFDNEQDLEAGVAALLRDAYDGAVDGQVPAHAPDISINLRRRDAFGDVKGEPKADAQLVLAPKANPETGEIDYKSLTRDIAISIATGQKVDASVLAALNIEISSGETDPPASASTQMTSNTQPLPPSTPPLTSPSSSLVTKAPSIRTTTTKTVTTTRASGTDTPPKIWTDPHVDRIIPQNAGNFYKELPYDRFNDSLSFAITNNHGKQLVILLRPADKNNRMEAYADVYTDADGDDNWQYQTSIRQNVAKPEGTHGSVVVLLDHNSSMSRAFDPEYGQYVNTIKVFSIYFSEEWNDGKGAAQIEGGNYMAISDSEYKRLQNAGSGVHTVKCVDGRETVYYK